MGRPLIAITTYRKPAAQRTPIDTIGVMPDYTNALLLAGAAPMMIPLGADADTVRFLLDRVDGVLLPGGGDIEPSRYHGNTTHPTIRGVDDERDALEMLVVDEAVRRDLPLLAICRGHQLLNVALGGALCEDVPSMVANALDHDCYRPNVPRNHLAHEIRINDNSRLADIFDATRTWVNSLHHQAVKTVGDGLVPTAVADDGVIEAVEHRDHRFMVGVQWHPENLVYDHPTMLNLFRALVDAAYTPQRV